MISPGIGPSRPGFDDAITAFLSDNGLPGCAFAVVRDGRVVYSRGYGLADRTTREPFTPRSVCRIGSLTKTLTAFTALRLVEEGRLSLAEPVFGALRLRPLPETAAVDPLLGRITVEQCLSMTAGWDRGVRFRLSEMPKIARRNRLPFPYPPTMAVRMLLGLGLDFDPGARQAYVNEGYVVLGRVIEHVTGRPFIEAIRQYVGIASLRLGATRQADRLPGEVTYYAEEPRLGPSRWPQDAGARVAWDYGSGDPMESQDAAGGIVCSVEDYAAFIATLTDPRRPGLRPETLARMTAVPPCLRDAAPKSYYGLGWYVFREGRSSLLVHGGVMHGVAAKVNGRPDGQTLIVLSNANNRALNLHDIFMRRLHQAANGGA